MSYGICDKTVTLVSFPIAWESTESVTKLQLLQSQQLSCTQLHHQILQAVSCNNLFCTDCSPERYCSDQYHNLSMQLWSAPVTSSPQLQIPKLLQVSIKVKFQRTCLSFIRCAVKAMNMPSIAPTRTSGQWCWLFLILKFRITIFGC